MPYRFLDSEKYRKELTLSFEGLGYEFTQQSKSYREESIEYKRIWNSSEKIQITWKRVFVSDGTDEQDDKVIIYKNESEIGTIDIDQLLNSKLEFPLNEEIKSMILEKIAEV